VLRYKLVREDYDYMQVLRSVMSEDVLEKLLRIRAPSCTSG